MDPHTSFDLVALLKQQPTTKKSHKIRPTQFGSVAGGIQKRLETNIKNRKSCRFSVFDRIRNISKCESPIAPGLSDAQQKVMHRKQQLEKWKEEKAKKKKEDAERKRKPFVAGMSQRQTFGPPPAMPSSSGRVTRSQARQKAQPKPSKTQVKSFAPSNAGFKPSIILPSEVPTLAPVNNKKVGKAKTNITFEPVLPKDLQKETRTTRTNRAKPTVKPGVYIKKKPNDTTKIKAVAIKKPLPLKHQMFQSSSSSSDSEQPSKLRTRSNLQKSIPTIREKPIPQEFASQDSACVSQETASLSSQDSDSTSQDASMLLDRASSQDDLHTPRVKLPKSESSSEEKLRSPKTVQIPLTPEQIVEEAKNSPCVTLSRGKANARKEMKKKYDEGLLDEDSSNMDSVNHFTRQLNSEIAQLTAMCETWDQIYAQTELPEPIQELVLSAVGQARLLMSKKLQQFAGLVESCARPQPGASLVTPADLQGFWDMVFMQVENVDMRFKTLEKLRLRNWIEEQTPEEEQKKVVPKPVGKKVVAKPSGGPSRLREMIAAARKAKQAQQSQSDNSGSEKSEATASPETKTFEAGFFNICSPLKKSTPATPSNTSTLLKSVLSSEAKKSVSKNSASFAMLRASFMSKNMEIEGVSPLPQTPTITVNLCATPARSILKQSNPVSTKKSENLKMVLFKVDVPSSPASYTSSENPGVAPLPDEDKENESTHQVTPSKKPASTRKSRLSRQTAVEVLSPVMTRSRRKSAQTPLLQPACSAQPALLQPERSPRPKRSSRSPRELRINDVTPRRSTRRRKSPNTEL